MGRQRLPLSRRPQQLTAAVAACALAAGALAAADASAATTVSASCRPNGSARPGRITLACGDANAYFRISVWRSWGGPVATGDGTLWANNCDPFCSQGRFVAYGGRIQLRRRVRCGRNLRYTRAHLSGPALPGWSRRTNWKLEGCP